MTSAIRRAVLLGAIAAAAAVPAAAGNGVTLLANTSFGAGVQYSDVYYHNGLAYIGTWTTPGKVFIAHPTNGSLIGTYATSNNALVRDLQVQGNTLYVALDAAGIDIVDISNPAAPVFITRFNTHAAGAHDLFIHGNTLYHVDDIVGSRMHIADVSNRAAPVHITTFQNPGGCHDITIVGNRAYLANLGGGFQIVDVSNRAAPVTIGTKNYSGSFTHNIWPSGDGRYVATTDETCGTGRLRLWDVSVPSNIVQVGEYIPPEGLGETCVHNGMWVDNFIYMSHYTKGLRVIDVTNPATPVQVADWATFNGVQRELLPIHESDTGAQKVFGTRHDKDDYIGAGTCFDGAWGVYAERVGPTSTRIYISDITSGLWEFQLDTAPNLATDGVAAYSAATGAYFLRDAAAPGPADSTFSYGAGGSTIALAGDWDGNGTKTPGLYDPATGAFFLRNANSPGAANLVFTFGGGGLGMQPIVGDWDGNDTETVGLYHPPSGTFFLRNANASGPADLTFSFGTGGTAVAVVGDWDDTDTDTIGIYAPDTGTFFLRNSNAPGVADVVFAFGAGGAGFRPIAGNWDGVASDSIGVYDPASAAFFLKNTNGPGNADLVFNYGSAGMTPLSGDWKGPGF